MTALAWNQPGERFFETGVDRGVLYLPDGRAVAWNGLTGVDDSDDRELKSFYMDGVKYLQSQTPGDFSAKLKAFTYPEEFDEINGTEEVLPGLSYHNQASKSFSLAYRTRIGNDQYGADYAYRIHILYNVMAVPDDLSFSTLSDSINLTEFSWTLTGVPKVIEGYRPTAHISIDSRKTDPVRLAEIEKVLYGTPTTNPSLPAIDDLTTAFEFADSLIVVDNGDGTWTAIDLSDQYITMTDPTTFSITADGAVHIDAESYNLSTTNP